MGSPRQTFAGETRLSRQSRRPRAAEGRSASHYKIYPSLLKQPRPCLSAQSGGGEGGGRREVFGKVFLREIFISIRPHPKPPNPPSPRSSICRRLSFKMNPSRNRRPET